MLDVTAAERLLDILRVNEDVFAYCFLNDSSNSKSIEEAFSVTAKEQGWNVTTCKNLWDTLVKDYTEYLSPSLDGLPKEPWCLSEKMSFYLSDISIPLKYEHLEERKPRNEENKPEVKRLQREDNKNTEDSRKDTKTPPSRKPKVKRLQNETAHENGLPSWMKDKVKVDDSRKMFLLSLLPDVESLSDKQLDEFRLKVLWLMEEIKES